MSLIKNCIKYNYKLKKSKTDYIYLLKCNKCNFLYKFTFPYGKKYNYFEFKNIEDLNNKILIHKAGDVYIKINNLYKEISALNKQIGLQEAFDLLNKTLKNIEFI